MSKPSTNNKSFFKLVAAGDRPSATEQNKITSALSSLMGSPNVHDLGGNKVRIVRLGEPSGTFSTADNRHDVTAQVMHYNNEDVSDASSQSQDIGAGFKVSSRDPLDNFCDPHNLIFDRHEIAVAVYCKQSAKWIPVTFRSVRHAMTCRASDGTYPARSVNPDTYPIQWIRLRYHEAIGRQRHDVSFLANNVLDTNLANESSLFSESSNQRPLGPDAYVHNIVPNAYIKPSTIIQVYNVTGQWFTEYRAEPALVVQPVRSITAGQSDDCRIYSGGVYTKKVVRCTALAAAVQANRWCVAWQEESSGVYYVGPWECADATQSESSISRSISSESSPSFVSGEI
jgi:hypothetical protein